MKSSDITRLFCALSICTASESWAQETSDADVIVITGSKTEKPLSDSIVSMQVITREEIEESGGQTAADLLENENGIQVIRSYAGTGLRLQGFGGKYILILVDGDRVNGRVGGNIDLQRLPIEQIERIEILKGPASALYGSDALGGVINIITRMPQNDFEAEAELSMGASHASTIEPGTTEIPSTESSEWIVPDMGKVSIFGGWRNERWNTKLTSSWHQVESYDLDPSDLGTSGSAFNTFDISQRTVYKASEDTTLGATTNYQYRLREGVDAASTGAIYDRTNLIEFFTTKLSSRTKFDTTSLLQLSGFYSLYRDQYVLDQRNSTAMDKDEETRDQIVQINSQYDELFFSKHLISIGTEAAFEKLEADRIKENVQDRYRMAVFIQDDWAVLDSPNLGFVPGMRLDFDSRYGIHLTPKAAIRYDPVDKVVVKASYGAGFRAPDFKELALIFENPSRGYIVEGNPNLEPETSHGFNLNVEYYPLDKVSFSISLFRNEIQNLISYALNTTDMTGIERYQYVNLTSAETRGGELSGKLRLWDNIKLRLGYAYTDSLDRESQLPLEGRPRHRVSSRLVYDLASWNSSLTINAVINGPAPYFMPTADGISTTYFPSRNENTLPNSFSALNSLIDGAREAIIDFRLRTRVKDRFTIFINVNNVLDSGDAQFFATPPLNIIGGISAKV